MLGRARSSESGERPEEVTMLAHRRSLLFVLLGLVVLGSAAAGYASSAKSGPRMGPAKTIRRKAFQGYYDGHKDACLNTDVSNKAEAASMHVNYAPALKAMPLAASPEKYLVEGRAASGQLAVFGSEPGESSWFWRSAGDGHSARLSRSRLGSIG
jgi:hypothetical protein